jgi:hypothetical protein
VLYDPSDHRRVAFVRSRLPQEAASRPNHARLAVNASQQVDEVFGVARQSADTPVEQPTKPMDLHGRGLLTDAEFEAQKQKLLGR